jgi:hypothetical protein
MTQVIGGIERLMREDLKPALAQEIREELREEVKQEVRQAIQQEVRQEIQQESRRDTIQALLKMRFGPLDDNLCAVTEALSKLAEEEFAVLVMTLSQEELIARFGESSI